MATEKPRLSITFDPDLYAVIDKLAEIQGIPKSKLIVSYLLHLQPHLEEMLKAFELVEQKKDPSPVLRKMYIDSQQTLLDFMRETNDD